MMQKAALAIFLIVIQAGLGFANESAPPVAKRMLNTVGGFEQLLRELFLSRASVSVGVQGKTLEGKIVGFSGGVLTLESSHEKGDFVYIQVSAIQFISQK